MDIRRSPLLLEAWGWTKTVVSAFGVYCALTTLAFANYSIPSESMVPTLEVGDRVVVSKFAYGYSRYSLPFDWGRALPAGAHRLFEHLPARGDVVVFIHPFDGRTIVKRMVGLPGDVITVRNSRLFINGEELPVTAAVAVRRQSAEGNVEAADVREETLPSGIAHPIHEFHIFNQLDNFGPYQVPDGHVFMMGDNRDNSLDSRWSGMGPVPIENLIGRAETVYFAPRACAAGDASCRARWLKPMHD